MLSFNASCNSDIVSLKLRLEERYQRSIDESMIDSANLQSKKKKKNHGILWFIVNVWFCKSLGFLEQFAGK